MSYSISFPSVFGASKLCEVIGKLHLRQRMIEVSDLPRRTSPEIRRVNFFFLVEHFPDRKLQGRVLRTTAKAQHEPEAPRRNSGIWNVILGTFCARASQPRGSRPQSKRTQHRNTFPWDCFAWVVRLWPAAGVIWPRSCENRPPGTNKRGDVPGTENCRGECFAPLPRHNTSPKLWDAFLASGT